eukprot:764737-Hanusia_phi.AAC.3
MAGFETGTDGGREGGRRGENNGSKGSILVLTNRIGTFSGHTGGGSAMREKLCAALIREGYELKMFAAGRHESADVVFTDYCPMMLPTWRALKAIWGLLKESNLVLVSGSYTPCIPLGLLMAKFLGIRSLVIFTTDSDQVVRTYYQGVERLVWWYLYSWTDRLTASLATKVYTRSEEYQSKLRSLHGIECDGVMVQSDQYGAFHAEQKDSDEEIRKARDLLSGGNSIRPLMIYAGRWAAEKRIELLVANKPEDFVVAIVGNGDGSGAADAIHAMHNPAQGVVCLREFVSHDRLRVFYKAADIHASASDFESLGNSAHESLLCGTPGNLPPPSLPSCFPRPSFPSLPVLVLRALNSCTVVLQRAGGYISQVEGEEQGFLVDWKNKQEVQQALWKALKLKNKVHPRQRKTEEGTDIVRRMLIMSCPPLLPRSLHGWQVLLPWTLRFPAFLALTFSYVNLPDAWPRAIPQGK